MNTIKIIHGMQEVAGSTPAFSTQSNQGLRELWGLVVLGGLIP